jgi:Zn-dependent protease with chaperone function
MLKKSLLLVVLIFCSSLKAEINQTNDKEVLNSFSNEITIKKIRKEVENLEKGIFGKVEVTQQNAPILYSTIQELAEKIELDIPKISISKGLFSPQTKNEEKLDSILEMIVSDPIILFFTYKLFLNAFHKIQNFEVRFFVSFAVANTYSSLFNSVFLGHKKNNTFSANSLTGDSHIFIGSNLIDNLDLEELKGIISHELGHLKSKYSLKLFSLIFVIFYLNSKPEIRQATNKLIHINNIVVLYPLFALVQRYFEKQADLIASGVVDTNKFIAALEKLYIMLFKSNLKLIQDNKNIKKHFDNTQNLENIFKISKFGTFMNNLFGSHPTFEQRTKYLIKASENLA